MRCGIYPPAVRAAALGQYRACCLCALVANVTLLMVCGAERVQLELGRMGAIDLLFSMLRDAGRGTMHKYAIATLWECARVGTNRLASALFAWIAVDIAYLLDRVAVAENRSRTAATGSARPASALLAHSSSDRGVIAGALLELVKNRTHCVVFALERRSLGADLLHAPLHLRCSECRRWLMTGTRSVHYCNG